ncbi:MAG: hypothetical protein AB1591_11040 [Pseudomonadota bacterium]
MNIVVLKTDLFPDADTVEAALAFEPGLPHFDLARPDMEETDWECVLDALLSAECVITL